MLVCRLWKGGSELCGLLGKFEWCGCNKEGSIVVTSSTSDVQSSLRYPSDAEPVCSASGCSSADPRVN